MLAEIIKQVKEQENKIAEQEYETLGIRELANIKVAESGWLWGRDVILLNEEKRLERYGASERASQLHNFCARKHYLGRKLGPREVVVQGKTNLIFEIGHIIHRILQDALSDKLIGYWRCKDCGAEYKDELTHKPLVCKNCGGGDFEYVEVAWQKYIDGFKITGHTDGLIDIEGERAVVEFKSYNNYKGTDFDISTPKVEHYIQVQTYLWLTGLKKAVLVYFNKKAIIDLQKLEYQEGYLRQFIIKRDEAMINKIIEKVKEGVKQIKEDKLPEPICKSLRDPQAIKCVYRQECFALQRGKITLDELLEKDIDTIKEEFYKIIKI